MTISFKFILLLLAFLLFICSAVGIGSPRFDRVTLLAVGLAFWMLTLLIPASQ